MNNSLITAILVSFISVFGGMGVGFFIGVVFGQNSRNMRAVSFIAGVLTVIALMNACLWLIYHGTLA